MIVVGFSGIANGDFYRRKYGLRFVGHDASIAVIADGRLVFAAEEERFSRKKHTSSLPTLAFRAALDDVGITTEEIDALAYPWHVDWKRFLGMSLYHGPRVPLRYAPELAVAGVRVIRDLMSPRRVGRQFACALGDSLPTCEGIGHHRSHSAAAYFLSPFTDAAVLTIDGQGEDESGSLGEWTGRTYRHYQSIRAPNSIGILYGIVTDFLGMRAAWDEYKVMGMAAYGDPNRFSDVFDDLVRFSKDGQFSTRRTAMVFSPGYCDALLSKLFAIDPRGNTDALEQVHFDIAASLQQVTEKTVFHLLNHLRTCTESSNLCLGGGVFQNSVINGKIRRSGLFDNVFIPPVPGDNGAATGAALQVYYDRSPGQNRVESGFSPFCGPGLEDIEAASKDHESLRFYKLDDPVETVARLLVRRRVIACVRGRMEFGARALGHRSVLASPIDRQMRDKINAQVKHRERFRPFAGSVLVEAAPEFFEIQGSSPFMQQVLPVRHQVEEKLGAICHFGTCRVQTVSADSDPFFHALLESVGRYSGVPVLLNTSFNDADEPIVCSVRDALRAFSRMSLDAMLLEDVLVTKVESDLDASGEFPMRKRRMESNG